MYSTQVHLALTHFPIIGTVIGFCLLAYGIFSKNVLLSKAGLVTFVAMALIAIPSFMTGEEAGNAIKNLPGVTEDSIDIHEEIAEKAIWFIEILGAFSLTGLFLAFKIRKLFKPACILILILSIATIGMMVKVGNTGGQIRHTEIRSSN